MPGGPSGRIVRLARADERSFLIELQRRASLMHDAYREALLAHPEAVDVPTEQIADGSVLVVEESATVLGFIAAIPNDDGSVEIDGLFVEPARWREGIGRLLVDAVARDARAAGATRLLVTAGPEGLPFYQALGFVVDGPVETAFAPAFRLSKILRPERRVPEQRMNFRVKTRSGQAE